MLQTPPVLWEILERPFLVEIRKSIPRRGREGFH